MKKRIISAIVALLIVIPLIIMGGIYFEIGLSIIAALAYKEIIDLPKSHGEIPNLMIGLGLVLMLLLSNYSMMDLGNGYDYSLVALILLAMLIPLVFYKNDTYKSNDAFYLIGMSFLLGIAFNTFLILRSESIYLLAWVLFIPMFNDIFAYLIGSKFGHHKMCKEISPNKTWEGSIGGLVVGCIISLVFYHTLISAIDIKLVIITIILSIVGQIGDLIMSKIKRENDIKDFSNIMPGHGGILDRLDSSIFVVLAYALMMSL